METGLLALGVVSRKFDCTTASVDVMRKAQQFLHHPVRRTPLLQRYINTESHFAEKVVGHLWKSPMTPQLLCMCDLLHKLGG